MSVETEVRDAAVRARDAAADLATTTRRERDGALHAMAEAVRHAAPQLLAANAEDVAAGEADGTSPALLDRLRLTEDRVAAMADGLLALAALPDPLGEVVRGYTLPNGLELRQVRVPLGVVGIVYEARPNVTVDAAGIAVKSGNAVLLRGSASAYRSNRALVAVLAESAAKAGMPEHAIQLLPAERESVTHLLRSRGLVDVIIPRGGAGLIEQVVTNSQVPVLETGVGNCHVYVDADADIDMAVAITVNAKVSRPSVCNAAETLLVHQRIAERFFAEALPALDAAGVRLHADPQTARAAELSGVETVPAVEADWGTEYLSTDLAVRVVDSLDEAVAHIRRWSSGHTEAIVTRSQEAGRRFAARVDAAAVMINASTRFTDGGEFGFGAEIGISTQKLHARGPMGLPELTSTKYIVTGDGHIRE